MLRQPAQPFDIAPYQLGRAVVVVIYRVYPVRNGMVGLAEADVDGEEDVDEGEDEDMVLAPEEAADSNPGFLVFAGFGRGWLWSCS